MALPKPLRPRQLNIRLTEEEDEAIRRVAAQRGIEAASLARMLLLSEVKRARAEEKKAVGQ